MLNYEETMLLLSQAQSGDSNAKEKLVIENMPLIKSIVRRFANKNIEYDDLLQLGSMGLIKAINNFDMKYNVQFSTYAVPMICGEIKRFIRDDGSIKVSRAIKAENLKISKYIDEYRHKNDTEPSIEEIAEHFNLSVSEIVFITDSSKMPKSIYDSLEEDGDNLLNIIPSEEDVDGNIDKLLLKDVLESLPEREKKIIMLRYYRDMTQSEIAKMYGISQVQISRIETKVLDKLRESFQIT